MSSPETSRSHQESSAIKEASGVALMTGGGMALLFAPFASTLIAGGALALIGIEGVLGGWVLAKPLFDRTKS